MRKTGRVLAFAAALALLGGAAAQAQEKIRVGSPYATTTLDPMRSAAAGNIETFGQLYSRLLRMQDGELEPGLAERWEVSEDGKTITLHLREAKFSDGSAIEADDVVFSLMRAKSDEASAYPAPFQTIESVEASDNRTVVVKLSSAFAPILGNLEVFNAGIVSKDDVEARGEKAFAEDPVTSGPYMVESWTPGDRLVLSPNPHYWREGYPRNPGAELIEVVAENTRVSMMLSGELDAARDIPWSQVADLQAREGIEMPLEPSTQIFIVLMNQREGAVFDDVALRQAAAMALDVPAITNAMTFGAATPANTTLPNALLYHDADLDLHGYDVEAAKARLAESGYDGREVVLLITDNPEREKLAVLIQAQWSAIGLKSRIEKVDAGAWWGRVVEGDYDASPNWYYNETTDPDLAVRWALCGSCGNQSYYTGYDNADINRMVDEGASELDEDKRRAIYEKIQEVSTSEVSQIPLYYPPFANAYSTRISGLTMTPALQWTLEDAEIVE